MPNHSRTEEIINKVFELLNQQKVSPEEGFVIAEEILLSSIERYAKISNLRPEDVKTKMLESAGEISLPEIANPIAEKKKPYIVGSGRGWIGNPNATNENN